MTSNKHLIVPELPVFTFLGTHADFSILGDGLTIYQKRVVNPATEKKWHAANTQLYLGTTLTINIVSQDHPAHDKYHLDSFVRERTHAHFQFQKPLNKENLSKILTIYVVQGLITEIEKTNCLAQYALANRLTQVEVDTIFARARLREVKKAFENFQPKNGANKREIEEKLTTVLTHFEQIIANEDHLHSAQAYLKEIENTFLFPTPTNFQKLKTLGHQASFMSSVRWKALGCVMVVLGGALVAMACLYMTPGVLLLLTGITGFGMFKQGLSMITHPYLKNDQLSTELLELSESLAPPMQG